MIGYYDYVLGLIPAALIGVTAFLNLVGLSLTMALPAGAGIALALMAHAMFVRGPLAGVGSTAAGSGSVAGEPQSGPKPSSGPGRSGGSATSGSLAASRGSE